MKIVFALLCLSVCAWGSNDPVEKSDSGIRGPKYVKILEGMDRLRKAYPGLVSVEQYGISVQGRPLRMLIVRRPHFSTRRPTLLMTGSTHGNEYLNLEDRLPEEILKKSRKAGPVQRFLDDGGAFVFVPILNPDGYDNHERENAHGVDINRDWDVKPAGYKGFKEPETRQLASRLDDLQKAPYNFKYEITVDYHCCIGALLSPWAYKNEKMTASDFHRHAEVGELAGKLLGIDYGPTGDVLGYYPVGTTKDYYFTHYGARAFTYEGRQGKENHYLDKHLAWWEKMVDLVGPQGPMRPFITTMKTMNLPKPFFNVAD